MSRDDRDSAAKLDLAFRANVNSLIHLYVVHSAGLNGIGATTTGVVTLPVIRTVFTLLFEPHVILSAVPYQLG